MIKVNLLKDQAACVRSTPATPSLSQKGLVCVSVLLLATLAMGIWSYYIHGQVTVAAEKRANLRGEEAHLQKIRKEIDKYQKLKQLSQSRIDAIEKLRKLQTGPVLLLNTVLQCIPRDANLWLISLTQNPDSIKIVGFAQQTEMIPDLMSNLATSGIFDIVDLEEIESQKEASKFSLICSNIGKTQAE